MGIAERKERDKIELKSRILDAARELFLKQGFDKTSIRNIADLIEYSPGIIYHYFKDKNDIFHALHSEGFTELGRRMQVLQSVENPMERLKAMGRIYIGYALENPDMYDLMFIMQAPLDALADKADWDEGEGVFNGLKSNVDDCMRFGHFQGQEIESLSFMIWSVVHGMVSLNIRQRCYVLQDSNPDESVEQAYRAFLKMIDSM